MSCRMCCLSGILLVMGFNSPSTPAFIFPKGANFYHMLWRYIEFLHVGPMKMSPWRCSKDICQLGWSVRTLVLFWDRVSISFAPSILSHRSREGPRSDPEKNRMTAWPSKCRSENSTEDMNTIQGHSLGFICSRSRHCSLRFQWDEPKPRVRFYPVRGLSRWLFSYIQATRQSRDSFKSFRRTPCFGMLDGGMADSIDGYKLRLGT